ncbi:MAG: adenylate/guanylate cyclase domain-containing protein [Microscillaceae bacterium]|nr:adenylate/guanylate cyclase domain-containing protein [Microscillaceae bacterium]
MKYTFILVFFTFILFWLSAQVGFSQDSRETLLKKLSQSNNEDDKVPIYIDLARIYKNQEQNYDEAVTNYYRAKHILEKKNNQPEYLAIIHEEIGIVYQKWKAYDKSITYFEDAARLRKSLNDQPGQVRCKEFAAWSHYLNGNYNAASQNYLEILEIHKSRNNSKSVSTILNRLAIISELNGQIAQALDYSQQDLAINQASNNLEGQATALNNIGYLQKRLRKTSESLKSFRQAIEIYEKMLGKTTSPSKRAVILTNIGVIQTNIRNFPQAFEFYDEALKIREKEGKPDQIGHVLNHIAANYFLRGDFERAKTQANRAISYAKPVNAWDVLLDSYRILSDIAAAEGNIQEYGKYNKEKSSVESEINAEISQKENELLEAKSFVQGLEDSVRLTITKSELEKERAEKAEKDKELAIARANQLQKEKELALRDRELAQTRARQLEQDRELARARAEKAEKEKELLSARARDLVNQREIAKLNEQRARSEAEKAIKDKELAEAKVKEADAKQEKLIADQKRQRQFYLFGAILAFVLLITLFISFIYIKNRQKNRLLKAQNQKIQEQNASLEKQKLEIEEQRDSLIELNEEITQQKEEISAQRDAIEGERQKSDTLLLNILPIQTAQELKEKGYATPRFYELVTVLFTDFKGFTSLASKMTPAEVIKELDYCFNAFEEITGKYGLEKIKTIGDAFMCAGGIPVINHTNPIDAVMAGLEIQKFMHQLKLEKEARGEESWEVRLGINSGSIVAGVIGKKKFAYDIWGDAVNVASRMETGGEPGKVNISGATYELVKDHFHCTYRGKVPVKHKGDVDMYFVEGVK